MESNICGLFAWFGLLAINFACFLCLVAVVVLLRRRKVARAEKECFGRLDTIGFGRNPQLHSIDKSIALSLCPASRGATGTDGSGKPFARGLLLIGGFGDPPHVWEGLSERASRAGWYILAPRTPGWGRTNFDEANSVSWTDWVLACRDALVIVRGLCSEVTVVAHSTGAPVVAMVVELFPVERLVFTGPNFVPNPGDMWAKKLLLRPIVGRLVSLYLRTVVKKRRRGRPIDSLNVDSYETGFYLTCLPVHALREMWILQDQLSRRWKVSGEVLILMGESDESVAALDAQADAVLRFLPESTPFRSLYVPNAAHGLPTETAGVVDTIAGVVVGDRAVLEKLVEANEVMRGEKKGGSGEQALAAGSKRSDGHVAADAKKVV